MFATFFRQMEERVGVLKNKNLLYTGITDLKLNNFMFQQENVFISLKAVVAVQEERCFGFLKEFGR